MPSDTDAAPLPCCLSGKQCSWLRHQSLEGLRSQRPDTECFNSPSFQVLQGATRHHEIVLHLPAILPIRCVEGLNLEVVSVHRGSPDSMPSAFPRKRHGVVPVAVRDVLALNHAWKVRVGDKLPYRLTHFSVPAGTVGRRDSTLDSFPHRHLRKSDHFPSLSGCSAAESRFILSL